MTWAQSIQNSIVDVDVVWAQPEHLCLELKSEEFEE